jgi:hypothetical protein
VITPESNRIIHPEGKQPRKEKVEDPCGKIERIKYESQCQYLYQITVNQIKANCHTLKYSFMNIAEYKILKVISLVG